MMSINSLCILLNRPIGCSFALQRIAKYQMPDKTSPVINRAIFHSTLLEFLNIKDGKIRRFNMAKVVVTGGSGKLGRTCVRDLLEHGYEVLNVDQVRPPRDICPFML